jgi:hypothetical protein
LSLDHEHRTPLAKRTAALYTADRPHRIENQGTNPARLVMLLIEDGASA